MVALAVSVSVSTAVYADEWVSSPGSPLEIDLQTLQRSGNLLRYRSRIWVDYASRYNEETVVASCVERKRGSWTDMRMYSVYPDTRNGNEVATACEQAMQRGVLPKELAIAMPEPARVTPEVTAGPPARPARISSGSGFYVNTSNIVTNFHVVDGCTEYKVSRDAAQSTATLSATDRRNDLALLQVNTPAGGAPSVRVSAALGEDIMVAGHPMMGLLSNDIVVTSGLVNSMAGLGNDPSFIQISAPVQVGNSGGPVIDRMGNVVGVVVSKVNVLKVANLTGDIAQNINFAIKPEVLRLFLDSNRIAYRSALPGKRLESTELAERARLFTVQISCTQ